MTVARAREVQRFVSQPFFVAEIFTETPGAFVDVGAAISDFDEVLSAICDNIPDVAFCMIGGMAGAKDKASKQQQKHIGGRRGGQQVRREQRVCRRLHVGVRTTESNSSSTPRALCSAVEEIEFVPDGVAHAAQPVQAEQVSSIGADAIKGSPPLAAHRTISVKFAWNCSMPKSPDMFHSHNAVGCQRLANLQAHVSRITAVPIGGVQPGWRLPSLLHLASAPVGSASHAWTPQSGEKTRSHCF